MKMFEKIVKKDKVVYRIFGLKLTLTTNKFRKAHYYDDTILTTEDKKEIIKENFQEKLGYIPNIDTPETFNEKIQWLKLYYDNPLIATCCDKYKAKEYIANTIGREYVVKLLGVYNNAEEIDFKALPKQFALKVNDNSGYNIIVKDKNKLNIAATKKLLNKWVQPWESAYYTSFNLGYKNVVPKIIAEEYLDIPNNSKEYKIFCFNGQPEFVLIELDYFGKNPKRAFYDRNFVEKEFKIGKMPKATLDSKPQNFDKMIELAEKLSKPFPLVRVDFYDVNGKIYFGELTFYSGGGFMDIQPREWDRKLGDKLSLNIVAENNQ